MPSSTTLGLDYFEHVETTTASAQALWAWWIDIPTWGDWSGWSRGTFVHEALALGSRGVVIDRFGRKASFTVTAFERFQSLDISFELPGAILMVRREITEQREGLTTFRHSAWVGGPLAT